MPEDNNSVEPVSLEEFGEGFSVEDSAEYNVNFPIEDGDDARKVTGTGASFEEAMSEAREKAAEKREELGLTE
jgi:hypothetical protein